MNPTQLFTNPAAFYNDSESRSLKLVSVAVVVVAVTQVIAKLPVIQLAFEIFSRADGPVTGPTGAIAQAIIPLIAIFVTWAGAAGIMYLLASMVYKSEGSITDTLAVVGWAYLPQVLYAALHLAVTVYLFALPDFQLEDSYATAEAGAAAMSSIIEVPPHQFLHLLAFLFILWGGFIAAHGISRSHDLDLKKSRIVALVPVVVWIVFRLADMARTGELPIQ